jgi:hypothetical protein
MNTLEVGSPRIVSAIDGKEENPATISPATTIKACCNAI